MNSLMVDIETMATSADAAVISIGVCAFNLDQGVVASDGWAIVSKDWHGEIDPSTVKWWSQQNEAARAYSFYGTTPSMNAAAQFKQFITNQCAGRVEECWANDPDFDLTILKRWWVRVEHHHKYTLGVFPISYKASRSCRTMFGEAKRLGINYDSAYGAASVAHNPIDDACNQARAVIQIRNNLIRAAA